MGNAQIGIEKPSNVLNTALKSTQLASTLPFLRCPPAVRVSCKIASALNEDVLLPEEASATTNFSQKRLAEFKLGRACVHEIFASLGFADVPLRVGESRQPLWPEGLVGSISHTGDIAICAIASKQDIAGIGIDIEAIESEAFDLLTMVASPAELERMHAPRASCNYLAKLLFSAKESVFKCQFTVTGKWRDFKDVNLELDFENKVFATSLKDYDNTINILGAWDVTTQHIVTAAWIA